MDMLVVKFNSLKIILNNVLNLYPANVENMVSS